MQRKPIANKYRKGMMKSTLQARVLRLVFLSNYIIYNIFNNEYVIWHTRSKGSERESEIAIEDTFFDIFSSFRFFFLLLILGK